MSSASTCAGSQASAALVISSCHQKSLPAVIVTSSPVRFTTITCSIVGHAPRIASAPALSATALPRRKLPSLVTSIFAPASMMRSLRDSALKPPNTIEWIAPMRVQASIAMASSGIIGRYRLTRSPFLMPCDLSTFANLQTSRWSSLYVNFFESVSGSPSQMRAILSPRVLRWRSRQL